MIHFVPSALVVATVTTLVWLAIYLNVFKTSNYSHPWLSVYTGLSYAAIASVFVYPVWFALALLAPALGFTWWHPVVGLVVTFFFGVTGGVEVGRRDLHVLAKKYLTEIPSLSLKPGDKFGEWTYIRADILSEEKASRGRTHNFRFKNDVGIVIQVTNGQAPDAVLTLLGRVQESFCPAVLKRFALIRVPPMGSNLKLAKAA